jgi:hypothetical protein
MRGWSFTILSSIILFVLKNLLANFVVTYALKDKQIAWLCLIEGNHTSLHDRIRIEDHVWFKDLWMVASWCDE